jgi:hypothetical protein
MKLISPLILLVAPFGEKSEKWNFLVCWYNPMLAPRARPFPANKCKIHRGL